MLKELSADLLGRFWASRNWSDEHLRRQIDINQIVAIQAPKGSLEELVSSAAVRHLQKKEIYRAQGKS